MKKTFNKNEDAVSPVIGVMLMIVVTVILAAAVSGFAGGIGGNMQKAPQLTMDVSIKNTGYAASSYITFDVIGVSEPIPTKDLKIITSWSNKGIQNGSTVTAWNGSYVAGAYNTIVTNSSGTNYYQSPLGFGSGVTVSGTQQKNSAPYDTGQYFGEYTLIPGTSMKNSPWYRTSPTSPYPMEAGYGYTTQYEYDGLGTNQDGMQAILGKEWNYLRTGDLVNIKIVHIPSGKVVFEKNVGVE